MTERGLLLRRPIGRRPVRAVARATGSAAPPSPFEALVLNGEPLIVNGEDIVIAKP